MVEVVQAGGEEEEAAAEEEQAAHYTGSGLVDCGGDGGIEASSLGGKLRSWSKYAPAR